MAGWLHLKEVDGQRKVLIDTRDPESEVRYQKDLNSHANR